MQKSKISIITVCYNAQDYILKTIKSVLDNKLENIEYIIIDGNSKDKTLDLIEIYSDKIDIIISEPDSGIYDAMNKGIKVATGDYITFLNADDYIDDLFLENVNNIISNYMPDYIFSAVFAVKTNGSKRKFIPDELSLNKKFDKMPFPHPGLLVRRKIFEEIGYFNLNFKYASDLDWILRMINSNCYQGFRNINPNIYYTIGGAGNSFKSLNESYFILSRYNNSFLFNFKLKVISLLKLIYSKFLL